MDRPKEVISRLLKFYQTHRQVSRNRDPFRNLVAIILSQNTSYRNEAMAYDRLEHNIGVTPENISLAHSEQIAEAIKPAGMHNQRSKTLKTVAEIVLECYDGNISSILHKPFAEARRELIEFPGVGLKTADVLLMFSGKAVIPIDRHIFRVVKRLQLSPSKAGYEEVRHILETAADPDQYKYVHLLLIRFGRDICRAQRPMCKECFVNDLCPYPAKSMSLP